MPLQIRRGTDAERQALIPSNGLVVGELLYVTDTDKVYIGTGRSGDHTGLAVTGYTNTDAVDAIGAALVAGDHASISFTYSSTQIDATVDLSNYTGTITADAFKGSLYGDDTSLLIDGVLGRVLAPVFANVTGNVTGNVVGNITGNVVGNITGNVVGNITGNVVGNTTGQHTGDVKGSVVGDDSTILVDGVDSLIIGDVRNDITSSRRLNLTSSTTSDVGILIDANAGGSADVDLFNINTYHNDIDAATVFFTRSKGTIASPSTLSSGDSIFNFAFAGRTTNGVSGVAAAFGAEVAGTVGDAVLPGKLIIYTTDTGGSFTSKLSIGPDGQQEITAPALVAGSNPGEVDTGTISSWMKVSFNGVEYAVPMYAIRP